MPIRPARASKATRRPLARVGRISPVRSSRSARVCPGGHSSGVPIRLTLCSSRRRTANGVRASSAGGWLVSTRSSCRAVRGAEQLGGAAGAEDHLDVLPPEQRPQERELEVARQGGLGAHAQRHALTAALLQGGEQLPAGGEDGVGMVEGDASGFRQMQGAAPALEQGGAEPLLELADLGRHCGLGDVEMFGGPGEVALVGHGVEVAQVVVVEIRHGGCGDASIKPYR